MISYLLLKYSRQSYTIDNILLILLLIETEFVTVQVYLLDDNVTVSLLKIVIYSQGIQTNVIKKTISHSLHMSELIFSFFSTGTRAR